MTRSTITLPGGVTVEVLRGDLTKFHADAIVNSANGLLNHHRGLAGAIATAGIWANIISLTLLSY